MPYYLNELRPPGDHLTWAQEMQNKGRIVKYVVFKHDMILGICFGVKLCFFRTTFRPTFPNFAPTRS